MKNYKKILALFMTVLLTVGMMTMHVYAEESTVPEQTEQTEQEEQTEQTEQISDPYVITDFLVEDIAGEIHYEDGTILVKDIKCDSDITKLKVEIKWTEGASVILVDDERLDGRLREGEPLLPEYVNFTSPRTFRLSRGEDYVRDYLVTVEISGHNMAEATCTEAAICKVCGYTEGEAKGHDMTEATCTEAAICKVCGYTEGEAKGHDMTEATCTEAAICKVCGYTEGEAKGHDMTEATCTEAAICKVCGYTEGEAKGHELGEWTVTKASTTTQKGEETRKCIRCDYAEVRSVERLNLIADPAKNRIENIKADAEYALDKKITFKAIGAGTDNKNPINGDTRYVPVKWRIGLQNTWKEFQGEASFTLNKAGLYRVNVMYQKQIYKDGVWQDMKETDMKEVKFKMGTEAQRKEEQEKAERERAVKTGDRSNAAMIVIVGMAAFAVVAFIMIRRRIYGR